MDAAQNSRIFWSEIEVLVLLSVFKEKKLLDKIDGKKHRRKDIFKLVEVEFRNRGYNDKNFLHIDTKWKNLKKSYMSAKKLNNTSGEGKHTCLYYTQLDELLSTRPSSSVLINAVDTSAPINLGRYLLHIYFIKKKNNQFQNCRK